MAVSIKFQCPRCKNRQTYYAIHLRLPVYDLTVRCMYCYHENQLSTKSRKFKKNF